LTTKVCLFFFFKLLLFCSCFPFWFSFFSFIFVLFCFRWVFLGCFNYMKTEKSLNFIGK
jgi:hypothetical protein